MSQSDEISSASGDAHLPRPAAKEAYENLRLKWLIPAILLLLAIGLGLKTWEQRQTDDLAALARLQGEARGIAAGLAVRTDTVIEILGFAARADIAPSQIAAGSPQIDAVFRLSQARQSPAGSRLASAEETALDQLSEGDLIGLSAAGDLIILDPAGGSRPLLALVDALGVLPQPSSRARIDLIGPETAIGRGNPELAGIAKTGAPARPQMIRLSDLGRAGKACAPVPRSALYVCITADQPLISPSDIARLLIALLLVAAPALTIFGLVRRLSRRQTQMLVQQTRKEESDRILEVVMSGARAGYWEWSKTTNSLFLSEGAAALLGIARSGLVALDELLDHIVVESHGQVRDAFSKARAIGWIHIALPMNQNPIRWIELRGSMSSDPVTGEPVFGGIMLDVTERKQAEDRVRAAERRLRGAIESFNGPFALWDARRRLLYWNRSFAIEFGLQDTLRAGMAHDTVALARSGAVLLERQSDEDARTTLMSLRSGRWVKMVERQTADGGLITVGIDVTENVRNEEELKRQKEKIRRAALELERSEGRAQELSRKYLDEKAKAEHAAHTKSAFLANMRHELRTPLNAVIGFSEVMVSELAGPLGDPSYKEYAADILSSGQHLLDMINDILDMAKIEAGKMTISAQPIDPVDPVDAALRMVRRKAEEKGIELILDVQPRLPDIDADHRAIRQMILNLVSNAIKFTEAGGRITVSVEQRGVDMYFSVTDTGIGIPAEDLPRLAQPFEQVRRTAGNYEGTGLGLALTKSFAEMHGGRMLLQSVYGEGTTVAFYLPISGPGAKFIEDTRSVA